MKSTNPEFAVFYNFNGRTTVLGLILSVLPSSGFSRRSVFLMSSIDENAMGLKNT